MKKKTTDEEIKDVMIEEKSRGKRKIDRDAEKRTKQFENAFYQLLREGDEKKFKSFLIAHGQQVGSEKYRQTMKLWNDYQKARARP